MSAQRRNRRHRSLRSGVTVGAGAFLMAMLISLPSQSAMQGVHLLLALPLLLLIILVGVMFDVLGVAVTAADDTPFHAMSAKKLPGARQALWLLRRADRVASFCNDVVGDLCGTLSGAAAAAIAYRLGGTRAGLDQTILGMAMLGLVAGLTVGGKAAAKGYAIWNANAIVYRAGRIMAAWEGIRTLLISWRRSPRHRTRGRRDIESGR